MRGAAALHSLDTMDSDVEALMSRVALAGGIGLLIGLERGWRTRDASPGSRTAGVRTFAIAGLLGGIVGALVRTAGPELGTAGSLLIGLAFAAFAAVFTLFTRDENHAAHKFSATTAVAGLLTFMLGVYALIGNVLIAAATAVAATGVLILREDLHEWVRKITLAEFRSVLVLLAMTSIALPIVPDRAFGPWGGVNPREIWIIAIVLAAISFGGFIAIRALGERRGVLVAGAIGGTVSSTAVLFANARAAAASDGSARLLAAGGALATAVSFLRVIAIVAALNPSLLLVAGPPLLAAAFAALLYCFVAVRWHDGHTAAQPFVEFRNPFGFLSVVGMAASMGVVMLVGRVLSERYGVSGAALTSAVTGLFDVDAMTVSMARLAPQVLSTDTAAFAILIGVGSATLGKVAIAAVIGRGRFALAVGGMSLLCVAVGALSFAAAALL
jgi:uncharacterized membrane protein (DUF4010 family)